MVFHTSNSIFSQTLKKAVSLFQKIAQENKTVDACGIQATDVSDSQPYMQAATNVHHMRNTTCNTSTLVEFFRVFLHFLSLKNLLPFPLKGKKLKIPTIKCSCCTLCCTSCCMCVGCTRIIPNFGEPAALATEKAIVGQPWVSFCVCCGFAAQSCPSLSCLEPASQCW